MIVNILESPKLEKIRKQKQIEDQAEYLRQIIGCELYKTAYGMPYEAVFLALELIQQDVENDRSLRGSR